MMRTLITALLCTTAVFSGLARHISEQEAFAIAKDFIPEKRLEEPKKSIAGLQGVQADRSLYVFNATSNDGFVIVAGDDRIAPILGYSDKGNLDMDHLPCDVKWLLDYYYEAISHIDETSTTYSATDNNRKSVDPLIYTQWGQGNPYNDLCPQVDGVQCITGCVATAMAQVINYHQWPQESTSGIPGYVTETHRIHMYDLPACSFDWNNMSNTNIARLMLYAGQSVRMDYTPSASGAYSSMVADALKDCFGFSKATSYHSRYDFSDSEWDNLLYGELAADRPVLYFGESPDVGGHAFIIDGFSDGLYHVNWGWDGYCDGFFYLDNLNPNYGTGFVNSHSMVVNAAAPAGMGDSTRSPLIVESITCNERSLTRDSSSSDFPAFNVNFSLTSEMTSTVELDIALGLYNDNGLVKVLWESTRNVNPDDVVSSSQSVTLDSSISNGGYRIIAMSRLKGNDSWLSDLGSTVRYIDVSIDDLQAGLMPIPKSDNDKYYIEFGEHSIDGITYRLYSEYENLRAEFISYDPDSFPNGELYIPDFVVYQNRRFDIFEGIEIQNDTYLTSISSSKLAYLWCLPNLKHLDLREGVEGFGMMDCSRVEELVFPKSCRTINEIIYCDSLRSITLHCDHNPFIFYRSSYHGVIWNEQSLPNLTDVYFKGRNYPRLQDWTWDIVYDDIVLEPNHNVTIHVASDSGDAYRQSPWREWNISEDLDPIPYEVQWDYCGLDENAYCGILVGRGYDNVEFAMRLPKEHIAPYIGNKISAIEFYTEPRYANDFQFEDVEYVFITDQKSDYITKQAVMTHRGQWMRIELDKPYTILDKDIFVGIGKRGALGANWANTSTVDDGMWLRSMGSENYYGDNGTWQRGAGMQDWNHPLPIRAIINGDNLPLDVMVSDISFLSDSYAESKRIAPSAKSSCNYDRSLMINTNDKLYCNAIFGEDGKYYTADPKPGSASPAKVESRPVAEITYRNRSPKIIKDMDFELAVDGEVLDLIRISTALLPNHPTKVSVPISKNLVGRNHDLTVNVIDIDGSPDGVKANSEVSAPFTTTPRTYFPRKFVLEEATGTWCGYCPRGIATIETMKQGFPDNFIAIAIHDDEMSVRDGSYQQFLEMITGFPSARLNRMEWSDLTPFDLDAIKDFGEAEIISNAYLTKDNQINIKTSARFGFYDIGENYRIAYVLVEDNVGPYFQSNYYSDMQSPDMPDNYLNWWIHQPAVVEMTYDDVARSICEYNGIDGLLPSSIEEGVEYECTKTLSLPDYIQNDDNLKIVTLLLDNLTGEILNADETKVKDNSGVETILASDRFDIYSPTGVLIRHQASTLDGLPKGIYIVNNRKILIH